MKLLITGFEPFGTEHINPSYEAVRMLPDEIDGCEIIKEKLPVVYDAVGEILRASITRHHPDAVLCVGQAGGYARVTLEYAALNIKDAKIADNAGVSAHGEPVVEGGPNAYITKLPIQKMAAALRQNGLPASISYSAGTYVCNSTMYQLLHLIETEYPEISGGFIHIPFDSTQVFDRSISTPYLPLETSTRALEICIRAMLPAAIPSQGASYYIHSGWNFLLADAFPMQEAMDKWKDSCGHYFYERDYQEQDCTGWKTVTLPHTFNDEDLFVNRIQDAGSGQKRTASFYRRWFQIPKEHRGQKVLIEFEGMRQTCYIYINNVMAGYYEAGTAPFGFDLTPWILEDEENLIAIATDNTTTRNIPFCIAETPNKPGVVPGSFLQSQDETVPPEKEGVGFFWNCNDFNPSVGGITRPVRLHFKPEVYLTLPLYSNLQTKGCYLYGLDYDIPHGNARIGLEAELRNEGTRPALVWIEVTGETMDHKEAFSFVSAKEEVLASGRISPVLSITPTDAYDDQLHPVDERAAAPTQTDSLAVHTLRVTSNPIPLHFWSISDPCLYQVRIRLWSEQGCLDETVFDTGFRKVSYDKNKGILINDVPVWLTGYAQRASNEWAAIGIAPEWMKDEDARLIKESNANHIRWMHVAASPADIRALDRHGIVCTQPAGDKEKESFGRQWDQRVELMRDILIAFRNHPSIFFWEAGNNSINAEHMREMRLLKEKLDPHGGRFMGCRTINTEEVLNESEYVGTMLNRHAARFLAEHGPITETEYSREESPRRVWDDFTPPDYDYNNKWIGFGGRKQNGGDFYDLTSEDLALSTAKGYREFFHDRIGGASGHNWYSACAALCWTDSAQHGRQAFSENARMSGRVDPVRIKKQNFFVYQTMQSPVPSVHIVGHWNYPPMDSEHYQYEEKEFNGQYWLKTGEVKQRNAKKKTVYVIGSYAIARVELLINGRPAGSCTKPVDTFVYPFPDIDITEQGKIEAIGYDYTGAPAASDQIETAGAPAGLRLSLRTSPAGFLADGADICWVDVEVLDEAGRICPLCAERIDFTLSGNGIFLGGYNSGRFQGYGHEDSVIHQNHVFAECGNNRVFVRSLCESGSLTLTARMTGIPDAVLSWESVPLTAPSGSEFSPAPAVIYEASPETPVLSKPAFPAIPQADLEKYQPEDKLYCKVLINGQEPDTRGVRSVNEHGRIYCAILCILERLTGEKGVSFTYQYEKETQELTLCSAQKTILAKAGVTHLLVNGEENLMDGEPYVTKEGIFVMEISAIISFVEGVHAYYDDKVNVFRIETSDQFHSNV